MYDAIATDIHWIRWMKSSLLQCRVPGTIYLVWNSIQRDENKLFETIVNNQSIRFITVTQNINKHTLYMTTEIIVIEQSVLICSKQFVKEIEFGILTQWLLGSKKKGGGEFLTKFLSPKIISRVLKFLWCLYYCSFDGSNILQQL